MAFYAVLDDDAYRMGIGRILRRSSFLFSALETFGQAQSRWQGSPHPQQAPSFGGSVAPVVERYYWRARSPWSSWPGSNELQVQWHAWWASQSGLFPAAPRAVSEAWQLLSWARQSARPSFRASLFLESYALFGCSGRQTILPIGVQQVMQRQGLLGSAREPWFA